MTTGQHHTENDHSQTDHTQTDHTQTDTPESHPDQPLEEAETMSSTSPMEYNGAAAPEPVREGTRLRTVVWGLVLILLGAVVIAIGLGARLDPATVFIGILAIAGATLLVGALVSAARGRPKD